MGVFRFKRFEVIHEKSAMKVGTDGVLLGAWAEVKYASYALDIGGGTGLISLMLAQRNAEISVDAVEIDEDAFCEMQQNFQRSEWRDRLNAVNQDILKFSNYKAYDLIVSNPPFFDEGTLSPSKSRLNARHNKSLPPALLIEKVNALLSETGRFCVIMPTYEGEKFIALCLNQGLLLTRKTYFLPKKDRKPERLLLQFHKTDQPLREDQLIQYTDKNEWHSDYKSLTKDFYLKL